MDERSLWFFDGAEEVESIFVLYVFFCGFGMELLMIYDPVLQDSEIFIIVLCKCDFLFFLEGVVDIFMGMFVFDFNYVLFIFVDYAKQLTLNLDEVFSHLALRQKVHFLFYYQIWIFKHVPDRISISSTFFFFIVEFQWFFIELSVRPGNIFVISAHLFPWAVCAKNKIHSSWGIH